MVAKPYTAGKQGRSICDDLKLGFDCTVALVFVTVGRRS